MKTQQTTISEVRLVYRTKVKASDRLQVKCSMNAFDISMENWEQDSIEHIEEFKLLLMNRSNSVLGLLPVSKEEYNLIKKDSIPCVTLSGVFTHRDSKNLVIHSGLMQVDIDKVEEYDATFSKLCKDDYIYVCFRSPGGKGIKAIVKINPSPETHKSQFQALEKYFKNQFGIVIDSLCKVIARAMLLSFDPYIYCNPFARVFEEMYVEKHYQRKAATGPQFIKEEKISYDDESIDVMERIIAALKERSIDITSTYDNWIKVGFALCTTFGEQGRGYYHRIGRMYPRYTPEETDKKYTQLLSMNNGKTKLGTIIFLAKEVGVNINKTHDRWFPLK